MLAAMRAEEVSLSCSRRATRCFQREGAVCSAPGSGVAAAGSLKHRSIASSSRTLRNNCWAARHVMNIPTLECRLMSSRAVCSCLKMLLHNRNCVLHDVSCSRCRAGTLDGSAQACNRALLSAKHSCAATNRKFFIIATPASEVTAPSPKTLSSLRVPAWNVGGPASALASCASTALRNQCCTLA